MPDTELSSTVDRVDNSPGKVVYASLSEEIATGVISPGTPLTEAAVAERLGVSRTPVREAFSRLEQDGLVERHGRGFRVRPESAEEIFELYEVRAPLEALAAGAAARKASPVGLARLEQAHRHLQSLPANSTGDERTLANRAFHLALWNAGENKILTEMLIRLNRRTRRYPSTTLVQPGRWEAVVSVQNELMNAIRAGDAEKASAIAHAHMVAAREVRLQMFFGS